MISQTSPLVGYNTNVRHRGKLYHIQTEDSGIQRPHIITHLFTDGGRIVASARTDYAAHLGSESLPALVKAKMQEQHKAMLIALRDGRYDESGTPVALPPREPIAATAGPRAQPSRPNPAPRVHVDVLDELADSKLEASPALAAKQRRAKRAGIAEARDAAPADDKGKRTKPGAKNRRKPASGSVAIERFIDERTLDRVMREYQAEPAPRQNSTGGRSSGR